MEKEKIAAVAAPSRTTCHGKAVSLKNVIPLSMVRAGERVKVKSISGKDDIRRFLSSMGFVEDAEVMVVSEMNGNVIVKVKGTRVAVSKSMANRVLTT
ncbi:FeoA domain protein [Acididesulfobacillus acetoxydans]|uniref:FeoA domain n=1 Tax=Acididesulfobacillus acetoxydans TaxID=1561005 RepID=A0A8S0W3S5_9FIRM|nr:FeoA family protein [Acididesulfobacillus acetoxydans]CAA7601958.1 FeoA domain protein [Acididesulfobacillus acetoxydans]CEJ08198.1 FeoA domain [Acididesulfobacillus acetoxydans]